MSAANVGNEGNANNFLAWLDQLCNAADQAAEGVGGGVLKREDTRQLVMAFAEHRAGARPDTAITYEECEGLVVWAVRTMLAAMVLETVLDGDCLIDVTDGMVVPQPKG